MTPAKDDFDGPIRTPQEKEFDRLHKTWLELNYRGPEFRAKADAAHFECFDYWNKHVRKPSQKMLNPYGRPFTKEWIEFQRELVPGFMKKKHNL